MLTGKIPRTFVDDVIARSDIVEVIDAKLSLKKTGANYSACCPFHQEKSPSFTVSPSKQFYYCFGCGAHGNVIGFLMAHERLTFVESIETLAHRLGLEVPREAGHKSSTVSHQPLYDLLADAAAFFATQLREHKERMVAVEYLKGRGVTGNVAKFFDLGYAPAAWQVCLDHLQAKGYNESQCLQAGLVIKNERGRVYDRFRGRLVFPIRNRKGQVIAFGGRVLDDSKPKYLNSPETAVFHKSNVLYGLYEIEQATSREEWAIVVEGYMDVVALMQMGIAGAIATLGTSITEQHCRQLFRQANQKVVFCFDGDEAGKKAAWRALEVCLPLMEEGRQIRFLFLPAGEDPDSFVRKEGAAVFREQLHNATSFSDFFIEHFKAQGDVHTMEGRAQLFALAKSYLQKLPQNLFGHLLRTQFAEFVRLPVEDLEHYLHSGRFERRPLENSSNVQSKELHNTRELMGEVVVEAGRGRRRQRQAGAIKQRIKLPPRMALQQRVVSLLLSHPSLYTTVEKYRDELSALVLPDCQLLKKVMSKLDGATSFGALMANWGEEEGLEELALLATKEWELTEEALHNELQGSVERLLSLQQEYKKTELIERIARDGLAGLSPEEVTLLGELFGSLHAEQSTERVDS